MLQTELFTNPFDVETPPEAEGWQDLYPYYLLFSEARRDFEEEKLWFQDAGHWPEVLYPFDTTFYEFAMLCLSQYNSRVFVLPLSMGIDFRVINGYAYVSPNPVTNLEVAHERANHFRERAGYYYKNWEQLYANWQQRIEQVIDETESITFPASLPEMVDLSHVISEPNQVITYEIVKRYHRLIQLGLRAWQLHFEMLNLGYAAYYSFFQFCKTAFPEISEQTIARMLTGSDVFLFQPDQEVKRLAHLAVALGLDQTCRFDESPDEFLRAASDHKNGWLWLEALDRAKESWFRVSRMTHQDETEDLSVPLGLICDYVDKIQAGEVDDNPLSQRETERDRLVAEYEALLPNAEDQRIFQEQLALARLVFPYVEKHTFFIEQWHHSAFWRKLRELGQLMKTANFLVRARDIFYLRGDEIPTALFDLMSAWAIGNEGRGTSYWPEKVAKRKETLEALKTWRPPRLLGRPPKTITDPFSLMLWGITIEQLQKLSTPWEEQQNTLHGFACSPGVVEGPARIVMRVSDLSVIKPGEILVCPNITPRWSPIFNKIEAVVTDVGGMMSHSAIVCREYNLPAVVGTAEATLRIVTGQHIKVDGNTGTVEILNNN